MADIVWSIDWMNTSTQTINGFSEVVVTAGWRCNGTDNSTGRLFSTTNYGSASFMEPPQGDPSFVPYANLTQDVVLGWCWSSGVNKAQIEEAVAQNLANLVNPPIVQPPLPWVAPAAG